MSNNEKAGYPVGIPGQLVQFFGLSGEEPERIARRNLGLLI